jgi:succinate dehydrogenase hydrophobic anchor subunit
MGVFKHAELHMWIAYRITKISLVLHYNHHIFIHTYPPTPITQSQNKEAAAP